MQEKIAPKVPLSGRFDEALVWASDLFREITRKGTEIPYLSHLMSVAALVLEHGGDEDEAIAALLHDAIEDCSVTREEISRKFGDRVADIVVACTDGEKDAEGRKAPWEDRKRAYIASLAHKSPDALRVSCADKLHNARAILADYRDVGEELWGRFTGQRDGTLWYYRRLAAELGRLLPGRLSEELRRTVAEIERLATAVPSRERNYEG